MSSSEPKDLMDRKEDLINAVKGLQEQIEKLTGKEAPQILLSFDEVDTLMFMKGSDNVMLDQYTTFMIALSSENVPGIYVTVQSSAAYVFDIAPSESTLESIHNDIKNPRLRPPFIELDFDMNTVPVQESQLNLQAVCTEEFITRFGRSLLVSILSQMLRQVLTFVLTGSERLTTMD